MKFNVVSSVTLEPGTYIATLETINAYTQNNKFKGDDLEPMLQFIWQAETEDGTATASEIVKLPRDKYGELLITEKSKLFNRAFSLIGKVVNLEDIKRLGFNIMLPDTYNTKDGLLALPHFDERREEGFTSVKVKSLSLGNTELIGRQAQINVITKNGYSVVDSTMPLPRSKGKVAPIPEDDDPEEPPV